MERRASSLTLEKHLFKGRVKFLAVNVDPCAKVVPEELRAYPNLTHCWIDEAGIRACKVQFVPQRVILSADGSVLEWWNGAHGKVVGGRHGISRGNSSAEIADKIAEALKSSVRNENDAPLH